MQTQKKDILALSIKQMQSENILTSKNIPIPKTKLA